MEQSIATHAFNYKKAVVIQGLLPFAMRYEGLPLTCPNCRVINEASHHFCTYCGHPVRLNSDTLTVYRLRERQRKEFIDKCTLDVSFARNALYLISACALLGLSFMFSPENGMALRGALFVLTGVMLFTLARWSLHKPFTALLISFLIVLTTAAITAWSQIDELFTSASGVYVLVAYTCLIYFLLRGVKAAYQADILQEQVNT